jgi:hypothetical protein
MNRQKLSQSFTPAELNGFMMATPKQNRHIPEGKNYYYSDLPNPTGGFIRLIALDMLEQPFGNVYDLQHLASFSQEQIDWLSNTALKENMTDGHSVIILTHFPFDPQFDEAKFVNQWNMIPEIIEAFRKKTTLKKSYPNNVLKDHPIIVNADFNSVAGNFICYLGGHLHATMNLSVKGLENASAALPPQLILLAPSLTPSEAAVSPYNKVERRTGSFSSNSFNIYTIDTERKTIQITFFGASLPEDDPDYRETLELKY